jgi:hypothetical protein
VPDALGSWPVVALTVALVVPVGLVALRRRLLARQEKG